MVKILREPYRTKQAKGISKNKEVQFFIGKDFVKKSLIPLKNLVN